MLLFSPYYIDLTTARLKLPASVLVLEAALVENRRSLIQQDNNDQCSYSFALQSISQNVGSFRPLADSKP